MTEQLNNNNNVEYNVKNLPAMQETQVQSPGQEDPWRREWLPISLLLTQEFQGQRSLVGYSPWGSVQFSSVTQSCLTLCNPMNHSILGLPVHQQLPEFTQTHAHWVGDAIQPSRPLSSPYPPALNLSQHQGLFQWVNSIHQVAKVLEFQLQHQSFQWTPRTDLL